MMCQPNPACANYVKRKYGFGILSSNLPGARYFYYIVISVQLQLIRGMKFNEASLGT